LEDRFRHLYVADDLVHEAVSNMGGSWLGAAVASIAGHTGEVESDRRCALKDGSVTTVPAVDSRVYLRLVCFDGRARRRLDREECFELHVAHPIDRPVRRHSA